MSDTSTGTDLVVRPYRDQDEAEVLDLIRGSLGGGPAGQRPPEYFRWKHLTNPFGRSFMIVAEAEGRIIGFRALMRWRFGMGDVTIEAVRPVDTVTHPEERGRGVFSRLTRSALDSLRGEVDLVFNTPNANSLPGYLKMGWQVAGQIPVSVRVRRPMRFGLGKLRRGRGPATPPSERPTVDAPTAAEALRDDARVAALLEGAEHPTHGWATPRSVEHLRWRYGDAPLLGYHAVAEERSGELVGLALFRPRAEASLWGLSVGDVIVPPGEVDTARRLLRAAASSADVAYVAATFPAGSTAARAHRGPTTIRAPHGMTFVVNPLRDDLEPDPRLLSSWALSTGDVEVF
jgi:GNAT superfamily N-acetyltransferase